MHPRALAHAVALVLVVGLTALGVAGQCSSPSYTDGYITTSSSAYLSVSGTPSLPIFASPFTVSLWARPTAVGSDRYIFSFGNQAQKDDTYLHVGFRGNVPTLAFWNDDYDSTAGSTSETSVWHYWTYTFSGPSGTPARMARVWKDGSQPDPNGKQLNSALTQQGTIVLHIGRRVDGNPWAGDIDDIIVWKKELTVGVIQQQFLGNFWGTEPTAANGCLAWWRFNEGSGTVAKDSCSTNTVTWNTTSSWHGNDANANCLAGYFNGFGLTLATPSQRVGVWTTVNLVQIDNWNTVMSAAYGFSPTSVTIAVSGSSTAQAQDSNGNSAPITSIPVVLTNAAGSFKLWDSTVGSVTFTLIDSASTGRALITTPVTQTFVAPVLTAIEIMDTTALLAYTYLPVFHWVLDVTETYTMTLPWTVQGVKVVPHYTGAGSTLVFKWNNGAKATPTTNVASAAYTLIAGLNTLQITSTDATLTFVYTFLITLLPPDLAQINLITVPAVSTITPAFGIGGDFSNRAVAIGGILQSLSLQLTFATPGSISQVVVNGNVYSAIPISGVPFDVTPFLTSTGSNSFRVTTSMDGGSYYYALNMGCPMALSCFPAAPNPDGCQYTCTYCTGAAQRVACLLQRPTCCGTPGCDC